MIDLNGKEIEVRLAASADGQRLWVNDAERCLLRAYAIPALRIDDLRPQPQAVTFDPRVLPPDISPEDIDSVLRALLWASSKGEVVSLIYSPAYSHVPKFTATLYAPDGTAYAGEGQTFDEAIAMAFARRQSSPEPGAAR